MEPMTATGSTGAAVALAATSTPTAKSKYESGKTYTYPADNLLIPFSRDPLFNSARTNSNEGVDKLEASMRDNGWGNIPEVLVIERTPGKFTVVAGIRRTKAARKVGIDARIKVLDPSLSDSALLSINIQENENRTETNPLAKAESFGNFIEAYVREALAEEYPDATEIPARATKRARAQAIAVLATNVKLHKNTVDEYLQLLNLGKRARTLMLEGTLKRVDATDRGLKLAQMLNEDGTPDEAAQNVAIDNYLKQLGLDGKKPARKDLKKAAAGESVGYKPNGWEIRQMTVNMEEAGLTEQLSFMQFLRGELTLRTAKKRLPWLKDVFVAKAGPGAAEGE